MIRYSEEYWGASALLQSVDMDGSEKGIVLCMNQAMTEAAWYRNWRGLKNHSGAVWRSETSMCMQGK